MMSRPPQNTTAFPCAKLFTDTNKRIITFFLYHNTCKFPFTTNEPAPALSHHLPSALSPPHLFNSAANCLTVLPRMGWIFQGAISASGISTKSRRCISTCGTFNSSVSMISSSNNSRSKSAQSHASAPKVETDHTTSAN